MSKREVFNIESVEEILNRNDEVIRNIKAINDQIFKESGHQKNAFTVTYGCQMNEHDSEKLEAMLVDMGYNIVKSVEESDLVIFNTCCVRENAEFKVYGNLGRIKKLKETKPDLILAVCGCMMQQPHVVEQIKKKYKYVDLVFGTHNLHNFPVLLEETLTGDHQVVEVWDSQGDVVEGMQISRKKEVKAYVNIMYGCDNFCSYCIVPYTRGRERSRRPEDIVEEIRHLALEGTKEVMLLGQNVNSYGNNIDDTVDFADLLRMVNEIEGIERIRFMTSHPKDITQKLIETMAEADKVCEYLHLPIQSGSNVILKNMNRKYTKEHYIDIIERAKALMPELGITTDIILGFPGETESDFMNTVDMIKTIKYDSAFTYLYSKRTGTPAATHDHQVTEDDKHDRMTRLLAVLNPMIHEKMRTFDGKTVEILVEGPSKTSDELLMGRTRQNQIVNFKGDASLIGKLVNIKITKPKKFSLFGEVVE